MALHLTTRPSAVLAAILIFGATVVVGAAALQLPPIDAVVGALVLCVLHWLSVIVHHLGHVAAAKRTGHPIIGIQFWGPFARDIYPADEGELAARVHVERALGGPFASGLLTLASGALWFSLRNQGGWLSPVLAVFFLDNLFVFTLQVVLPLGFNDGATLWKWIPRLRG